MQAGASIEEVANGEDSDLEGGKPVLSHRAGVPLGADPAASELERECRQLGLSVSLLDAPKREVDVASVLDKCLAAELWR